MVLSDQEDAVISFGFFDGSLEELRDTQRKTGRQSQVAAVEPHVDEILLDGSYEVVEELAQ